MVNAMALSGSNNLFSMLRISDLNEERKRHDQAVGQLQAAQAKWSRKWTKRLDWISEDLRRQGHAVQTFEMSTTQCANTRGSPEYNLVPWDLSPSCQTSTCRAVAKETVRSPSLYWEWSRPPGGLQTRKVIKKNACCGSASIAYPQHIIFSGPTILLLLGASQHNWTDSWVRGFRMLEAYQAV